MSLVQRLVDRVLNDERENPFDYEPGDLNAVEADAYDPSMPDEGDADSAVKP